MPSQNDKKKQDAGDGVQNKSKSGERRDKSPLSALEELKRNLDDAVKDTNVKKCTTAMAVRVQTRRCPEVSKSIIKTRRWHPPSPPRRQRKIEIQLPQLTLRRWIPPMCRRRKKRPKLARIPPEEMTQPLSYDCATLKKIWHNFIQVKKNKMMLQGTLACNSKRYSPQHSGVQTACAAAVCTALLDEKDESLLNRRDVDDIIENADRYYHQCMLNLKCYTGPPALEIKYLLNDFFLHDTKYTVRFSEADSGVLMKNPDGLSKETDLMDLMEKRIGKTFCMIVTVGRAKHFLVWGHPPAAESGSHVKTICYVLDPHMLNDIGQPDKLHGAGAFLRFAGVQSFVFDFLANYADLEPVKRGLAMPRVTITDIEIAQKQPLEREALWDLDLKTFKIHCQSEWESINNNALYEKKLRGEYPRESLSAVSLATSRAKSMVKLREYYRKKPNEQKLEAPPVPPEKGPPAPTVEQILSRRGEDFFLFCTPQDAHAFGRDDLAGIPTPRNEPVLHSLVDLADKNCSSQYVQLDVGKWLLRATRHMASFRYQKFLTYTAVACCVAALAVQRRLRARSWNEDTLDETLDVGFNLYRESLSKRGGPIRRLVLGELTDKFVMRDKEYKYTEKGIAVWGKIVSSDQKVFDMCRGIDHFFKESDSGVLQIPGEIETAIMHEGDKYYIYIPWPADVYGKKVDIRAGGKACILHFDKTTRLCDYFLDNWAFDMRRKPFSISAVNVFERTLMPEPINNLKPVDQNRWVIRGSFHEADARFPESHRGKQATPVSIVAIALANILDPDEWKPADVNEALERGDVLYQSTIEHLDRLGIGIDTGGSRGGRGGGEEAEGEEEDGEGEPQGPSGTLAAVDVLNRFKVTDTDCIETEVLDSAYTGTIQGSKTDGILSLRESLQQLFSAYQYAVLTARGGSMAVWRHNNCYYFFDPHGCDENGYPADEARAAAALVRVRGTPADLADTVESNLAPGVDDSFNLSPVAITATKLSAAQGVPETTLERDYLAFGEMDYDDDDEENKDEEENVEEEETEIAAEIREGAAELEKEMKKMYLEEMERWKESKSYEWYSRESRGTAAIMVGPRGENSAIGKAATKAGIGEEDQAGRNLGLAAAAAFTAASASVPPPHMHQDHMFNFLDAGADFYNQHVKKTGRKELTPEDLTEKFEMGANTFSIELGEPIKMTLRIPDESSGEGGGDDTMGEGVDDSPKHMKDILNIMWNDTTKPTTVSLLVGDYHQLGVWMTQGGKVVAFDPAPTLLKGLLINQRIVKGDQLRLQRLKDEMTGEGDDEEAEDEEAGGEGEEKPELPPEEVPPESCPVLMLFAGPGEFIDKLASQGPLSPVQTKAPYKLYPVKVTNELTSLLRDRRDAPGGAGGDEEAAGEEEEAGKAEVLVEELLEEAIGAHFTRLGRSAASIRGRVAQHESYFLDKPNRDHQDAANSVMAIVVEHIEPYRHWKPVLIDAILKYGDRLYTLSLPRAAAAPALRADELVDTFHVTSFNVSVEVSPTSVSGDVKAGSTGPMLDLARAIKSFFDEGHTHGVMCCKNYCAAIWKNEEGNAYCYWDPHAVGPRGGPSPGGSSTLVVFSNIEELANTYKANIDVLARPGNNKFTIQAVTVKWEYSKVPAPARPPGAVPDDTYEWKVLTAYVETDRGRTILRGSRPAAPVQFASDALVQSSCGAAVAGCMSRLRRPSLWTSRTVDEVMTVAAALFTRSVCSLGYEFRPGDDMLLPLQVAKQLVIGVNYIMYDLQQIFTGRLESRLPTIMNVRVALETFFDKYRTGILWAGPYAVAVWREDAAPNYYMMEPHSCGPTGLRTDGDDDGAACTMTFTSAKLLAFHYLQNTPIEDRDKHDFILYSMAVVVKPIKPPEPPPPPPSVRGHADRGDRGEKTIKNVVVPATSKVNLDGSARRADEASRRHPPGHPTCDDTIRATAQRDKEDAEIRKMLKGQRSPNGWLIMCDGSSFLSATHSMNCRQFSNHSKGHQAVPMSIMAVAMSRVDDICKWDSRTLDQILYSGDQLYQDSILHFRPKNTYILAVDQVLRKFYTPGNCVCRVVIFNPRQNGQVDDNLLSAMTSFFTEEKCGVFVANDGVFAVALFRNNRGFFMFDPGDRDRYGRAVAEPCYGKARACFSHFLNVKTLCAKLAPNIPLVTPVADEKPEAEPAPKKERKTSEKGVMFAEPQAGSFIIYGMDVTGLRRLTNHEM